jgi:hypothetical protein
MISHDKTAESMSGAAVAALVKKKVIKGVWRMPRLIQAMKDVISCVKPRVGANDL